MENKRKAIIDILKIAQEREKNAFNFYVKATKKAIYPELEALLLQLAEEERKHRYFLEREIQKVEKYMGPENDEGVIDDEDVKFQLPKKPEFKRIHSSPYIDLAAVSLPVEFIGGDYLDTISLERDGSHPAVGIFLYDVMGHGMEATHVKAFGKKAFGELREASVMGKASVDVNSPQAFMGELNQNVVECCSSAGRFITAIYTVFDPVTNTMTYASAGHDPPILIKADKKYVHLEETDLLLGADASVSYHNVAVPIEPGDVIVLFSDGIIEATNPRGKMFERTGLRRAVQQVCDRKPEEIIKYVFGTLRDFLKKEPITDEFTLAVMKVTDNKMQ